nr:unnamed protein product [Digitaria exilis]
MDVLPNDLVANVLGRLAPCSLAASRCVRKAWRAIVDARRLLRTDLLPLRLDGFFCCGQILLPRPHFFSRPSIGRRIGGGLDLLDTHDDMDLQIMDHCNGLLLLYNCERVVNPATRQWAHIPPSLHPCRGMEDFYADYCLIYDPIVSPHYKVFMIPLVPVTLSSNSKFKEDSEWPSSPYTTHLFSSKNGRWEEKSFIREGDAAGTIADMLPDRRQFQRHAIYMRGVLYVHCQNDSVMRITLSDDEYQMIKSPVESKIVDNGVFYLGKSEKGVYFALLWGDRWPQFRVWLLNESCGQMEWLLKSDTSLQEVVQNFPFNIDNKYSRPWIVNYVKDVKEAQVEEESEWDFDNGIVLETKAKVETDHQETFFLGFHPYKEIAFFWVSHTRVVSYHLNSSKVQELGILHVPSIMKSFPYTPCMLEVEQGVF